jgi:hypothetical protein
MKACLSPGPRVTPVREPIRMDVEANPTTRNGNKHMKKTDKYVGQDVHQDTTAIAVAESGRVGEVRAYGTISSDLQALARVLGKLGGEETRLRVVTRQAPRASWSIAS